MAYIDTIKVGETNYDVLYEKSNGANTVTSLSNLPVTKSVVLANISSSSAISLAGSMRVGENMDVICVPSKDMNVDIGNTLDKSFDGIIEAKTNKPFGLNVICYATGKYIVSPMMDSLYIKKSYTVTFNVTPSDATIRVNDSIISGKTYTALEGTTINWNVSKTDYTTQSGSFVLNGNKTVTVNLEQEGTTIGLGDKYLRNVEIGDYWLSDGTFLSQNKYSTVPSIDCIGICFAKIESTVGDPPIFKFISPGILTGVNFEKIYIMTPHQDITMKYSDINTLMKSSPTELTDTDECSKFAEFENLVSSSIHLGVHNWLKSYSANMYANNLGIPDISATPGYPPSEAYLTNAVIMHNIYCWNAPSIKDVWQIYDNFDAVKISAQQIGASQILSILDPAGPATSITNAIWTGNIEKVSPSGTNALWRRNWYTYGKKSTGSYYTMALANKNAPYYVIPVISMRNLQ